MRRFLQSADELAASSQQANVNALNQKGQPTTKLSSKWLCRFNLSAARGQPCISPAGQASPRYLARTSNQDKAITSRSP